MKQRKLASLLAVTISLEMMVSPLLQYAHAEDPTTAAAKKVNSQAQNFNEAIKTVGTIWNSVNQMNQPNMMNPQMAGDMQKLEAQRQPQPDKYFNAQKLSQIPGLGEYLAMNGINPQVLSCSTLPTTTFEANPEVCRIGITGDTGLTQPAQLNMMFTYYNQYFQIEKQYKNYSAESNSAQAQAFGVGCMNNAMKVLNGFFKYRIDELDKLTTNLEAMQQQWKDASRADLDAIEESVAVLEGGNSDLTNKVKSKKPDLFDFGKRFNNPACNSMFANNKLNEMGREKGLNGIDSQIKEQLTSKEGMFSGESYTQMHASIVEDINKLSDKASKQFELNFASASKDGNSFVSFLKNLPNSVSSAYGLNSVLTADKLSDTQTKFNETTLKLEQQKSVIKSELGAQGIGTGDAERLLGSANSGNFESEVNTIENRLKNNCFNGTLSSMGKDKLLNRIYDPSASKFANQNGSNFLKDKLLQVLDNPNTSLEKKLEQLKSLEAQTGSRYYMKMDNSYEVQDVDANGNITSSVVDATSVRTPSVFFSDLIRNCNAQFKANKLNNKMTGSSAIQQLRQLNQGYKDLQASQAAEIKKELKKRLIECSSPEVANNTVPGSCEPGLFDTRKASFCANAAFSCSKNMQACNEQSKKFVKEIKDQRTARVNNYKALAQKNKKDIVKMFDSALSRFMKEGEMMRGVFGAGFSSPVGIERDIDDSNPKKYLNEYKQATNGSLDGTLLLENPDAYVDMFKKNITALKKSVQDQQNQILGGDVNGQSGLLADHIRKTGENYKQVAREAGQMANKCLTNHDNAVRAAEAARQKAAEESQKLGEKQNKFCKRFNSALNGHPGPACSGGLDDLTSAIPGINDSLEQYCDQSQNSSTASAASAYDICDGVPSQRKKAPVVKVPTEDEISKDNAVKAAKRKKEDAAQAVTDIEGELSAARTNKETAAVIKEITDRLTKARQDKSKAEEDYGTVLDEAKTRLTKTETPDEPGSNTAAAPESGDVNKDLIAACDEFRFCDQPTTYTGKGEDRTSSDVCTSGRKNSTINKVMKLGDKKFNISADMAPAFCVAGDNSNRAADTWEQVRQTLQQAIPQTGSIK